MPTKVILDGALFSECERLGSNRSGMHRVAEDVTTSLVEDKDLEIYFANTIVTRRYDQSLRKYITENYPSHSNGIVSKKIIFSSTLPKWKGVVQRFNDYSSRQVIAAQLKKGDVFHSFYHPVPHYVQKSKIHKSITFLDIIPLRREGYPDDIVTRTQKIVDSIVPNFAISISEFSKQDLLDYDKRIDPARVFVVPLAASRELFFQNKDRDEWNRVKRKYNLPDNYFLSVSSSDERKNLRHLIKSFSRFVLQQGPKDLFLVLTGNFMYSYAVLDELKIDKKAREKIIITEKHIENKDLSVVYSNALCFFFMSLYEGFGLPVLEAMQCGTPAVASTATSLPEVVGDAGIMLPPLDEDALCEVMNKMYHDTELRDKYAQAGLERARQFSWKRCAAEYAEIFRNITLNF